MGINLNIDFSEETTLETTESMESLLFATIESMENLANDEARVIDCLANIESFDDAVNNTTELHDAISNEGISGGILELFNKDNKLAMAIGRKIDVLTDENAEAIATVCVEGLMESLKKAGAKIKEIFQKILKTVMGFLASLFDASKRQLSTCGKIKEKLADWVKEANDTAYGKLEVKAFAKKDFDKYITATGTLVKAITGIGIDKAKAADFESVVKDFGYKIEDDKLKKSSDGFSAGKAKTIKDLGWKLSDLDTTLAVTMDMLKDTVALKSFQKSFKADIDTAVKVVDAMERAKDSDDAKKLQKEIDVMKKNAVLVTQLVAIYGKASKTLAAQTISLCGKVKGATKEEKKDDDK